MKPIREETPRKRTYSRLSGGDKEDKELELPFIKGKRYEEVLNLKGLLPECCGLVGHSVGGFPRRRQLCLLDTIEISDC